MTDNSRRITKFGDFSISVEKSVLLMADRIQGKSLIIFDSNLNPYDFKLLLEQIKTMGITLYWSQTLLLRSGLLGYRHLAIVKPEDVNLVRVLAFKINVVSVDELLDALKEEKNDDP